MKNKRFALVSNEIPAEIEEMFSEIGRSCIRIPAFGILQKPVQSHPDMLFSQLTDGTLLCDGRYLELLKEAVTELPVKTLSSKKQLGTFYPGDIIFDALRIGDTVYGKVPCIAPEILENAKKAVCVAQGYTLCSTCVTDKCAITADMGIAEALKKDGFDTLLISPGGIVLPGYGCGFIGGASAYDSISDSVLFFGYVTALRDGKEIIDFLQAHGHKVLYSEKCPLSDYGGAKML